MRRKPETFYFKRAEGLIIKTYTDAWMSRYKRLLQILGTQTVADGGCQICGSKQSLDCLEVHCSTPQGFMEALHLIYEKAGKDNAQD